MYVYFESWVLLIFKDVLSHFAKFQYDLKAFTAILPTLQQAWRTLVLLVTHRSFPLGEEEGVGIMCQVRSTWTGLDFPVACLVQNTWDFNTVY